MPKARDPLRFCKNVVVPKGTTDGIASGILIRHLHSGVHVTAVREGSAEWANLWPHAHMIFIGIAPPLVRAEEFRRMACWVLDCRLESKAVRRAFKHQVFQKGDSGADLVVKWLATERHPDWALLARFARLVTVAVTRLGGSRERRLAERIEGFLHGYDRCGWAEGVPTQVVAAALEYADALDLMLSLDKPCSHPARNGIHEVYGDRKGSVCRACGAKGEPLL